MIPADARERTETPWRARERREVGAFVALAFALSWWPWALSPLSSHPEPAVVLPIGPSVAAVLVTVWFHGRPGLRQLGRSLVAVRIGLWWWSLLIPPTVVVLAVLLARLLGIAGAGVPDVAGMLLTAVATLPLVALVSGPLGEELGWRGYLLPRLLRHRSPLTATLLLLPVWVLFHLPLAVSHPDRYGLPWAVVLAGVAVTMTWLYLGSGGSIALAVVFHAAVNTTTAGTLQLFPPAQRSPVWWLLAAGWLLVAAAAVCRGRLVRGRRSPWGRGT